MCCVLQEGAEFDVTQLNFSFKLPSRSPFNLMHFYPYLLKWHLLFFKNRRVE